MRKQVGACVRMFSHHTLTMAAVKWSVEKRVKCVRLFTLTQNISEVQRRSPDLTPPDFFLWGYLKDKVYAHPIQNLEHLRAVIVEEFNNIPIDMIRKACENVQLRLQACIDIDGAQVDYFDVAQVDIFYCFYAIYKLTKFHFVKKL